MARRPNAAGNGLCKRASLGNGVLARRKPGGGEVQALAGTIAVARQQPSGSAES